MRAEEAIKFLGRIVESEGYTDIFQNACRTAIGALEKTQWISVKDRLPKKRMDCVCVYRFGDSPMQFSSILMFHPEKDAYNGYVKGPHFSNEGMDGMKVTHWKPLGRLPEVTE